MALSQTSSGARPLHEAAASGYARVVQTLLECGAEPAMPDELGQVPLEIAAYTDVNAGVVASLLAHDHAWAQMSFVSDLTSCTPVHTAARHGAGACLSLMLSRLAELGRDVDSLRTAHGATPLHVASSACCVRRLLEHGASPSTIDSSWTTPLAYFARSGNAEAISALQQHAPASFSLACACSATDDGARTVLMHAVQSGSIDAVQLVLGAGADLDAADLDGHTAISLAQQSSNPLVLLLLIRAGGSRAL